MSNEQNSPADAGPLERRVVRPAPEREDDGPLKPLRLCACVSDSALQCAWLRYHDDSAEPCYCPCHEEDCDDC